MDFSKHFDLVGQHAFLSASSYHWINYTEDKLDEVFFRSEAAKRGTELHAYAHMAIRLKQRQAANGKTVNTYVNDALGYRMASEQIVYFSRNAFGTADTIQFSRNKLRIHDLKTGVFPASVHQLEVYAALFCLEYRMKPFDIEIELRIYQNDEVLIYEGDPTTIVTIMDRIVSFDRRIEELRMEVE